MLQIIGKDNFWEHYIDLQIFIRDLLHFKKAFVSDRHKFANLLKLAQNYKMFDPSESDQVFQAKFSRGCATSRP